MNKKRNIDKKYLGLIIVIIICAFGFYNRYKMKSNSVYCVANIYNITTKRGGHYFDFQYIYQGSIYTGYASSYKINKNDEGRRFFVEVNSKNPDECLIDISLPVPDSISEAPYDGWKELPIKTDK